MTDKRKTGTHPPHPKCPKCGRAMYKTMTKGASVKKTDPFAFCRNAKCELHGVDQSTLNKHSGVVVDAVIGEAERKRSEDKEAEAKAKKGKGKKPPPRAPKAKKASKKGKKKGKKAKSKKGGKGKAPKPPSDEERMEQRKRDSEAIRGTEPEPESEPEPAEEDAPDGVDTDTKHYQQANKSITNAVKQGGPFLHGIVSAALAMVVKHDGVEAANHLIAVHNLTDECNIQPIEP